MDKKQVIISIMNSKIKSARENRKKLDDKIFEKNNLVINRIFSLDKQAYTDGGK